MKSQRLTASVALIVCMSIMAAPNYGAVTDREVVLDVKALSQAIQEATEPISERMRNTKLKDQFDQVNAILKEKEVDKERLVEALKGLKSEMDKFTTDWNTAVDPLWQAQENIATTIDRVRIMLTRGTSGAASQKAKAQLENFDARLSNLARSIQTEPDETRKTRLTLVFQNTLALRKLVEHAGSVNLDPTREAVYTQIVHALTNLENQLTAATFGVERARIILVNQSDFVHQYTGIMEGLVEAEKLSLILAGMSKAGKGIGALAIDVNGLVQSIETFAGNMDEFATKLSTNIETQTAKVAADQVSELKGVDIQAAIEFHAKQHSPKRAPEPMPSRAAAR